MSQSTLIRCPGCETVVEATRAACPGCGQCLICGDRRASKVSRCPACDIPYCDCCGRCSKCLGLRYAEISPCHCGHPTDQAQIQKLLEGFAITSEATDDRLSELLVVLIILAVIVIGVVALILWWQ